MNRRLFVFSLFILGIATALCQGDSINATAASSSSFDYAKALSLSFLFYDAQRSGALPPSNTIPYRGNSFLNDCTGAMSGGFFDAGDHLKLLFPMSTAFTFLGLAAIEFPDAFQKSGQLQNLQDTMRWAGDILIKAHVSPFSFIGQVGDPGPDHSYWGRPEDYSGARPCFTWDMSNGQYASDLAGAAASALAAVALVFQTVDPHYADLALSHAKQLYKAASTYEGKYSTTYSSVTYVYSSATFRDDLALAATMLWMATGDDLYVQQAKLQRTKSDFQQSSFLNWDSVGVLSAILLQCRGESTPDTTANINQFLSDWENCNSNGFTKTPQGLCYPSLGGWGNLRHATTAAFGALLVANCNNNNNNSTSKAVAFAQSQVNYALGSSGRSFVIGFGKSPPAHAHHRAASCPNRPASCGWPNYQDANPNPQVLYGALVGGPAGPSDAYDDSRQDFHQNEVALDFNAGYTGALAGLIHFQSQKINSSSGSGTTPAPVAAVNPVPVASPSSPTCTDTLPAGTLFSCQQQAAWGKCSLPWMRDTCNKSCGRC